MRIIAIFKNILQKSNLKPPLGRWNIEQCDKKLNYKIDLANEDHCGPCGKYVKIVLNNPNRNNISSKK